MGTLSIVGDLDRSLIRFRSASGEVTGGRVPAGAYTLVVNGAPAGQVTVAPEQVTEIECLQATFVCRVL